MSAYPQEVTAQMVRNFLAGGAAVNVLAAHAGARVVVADLGVAADLSALAGRPPPPARGWPCARWAPEPATWAGAGDEPGAGAPSLEAGIAILEEEAAGGLDIVGIGEMGIGNTTPAAAITAVMTGTPVREVTGRGTGLDEQALQRKVRVIEAALAVNHPDPRDALGVLAAVGGFEIGGMAGAMLAAAARSIPVVVDGFICAAAALIAAGWRRGSGST